MRDVRNIISPPFRGNQRLLTFKIEVVLPTNWTLLAVFDPFQNALGMELVPALQDVLGGRNCNFLETNRALELLLVHDGLLSVLLPNRVYHVFVASAASAPPCTALQHP